MEDFESQKTIYVHFYTNKNLNIYIDIINICFHIENKNK